MYVFTKLIALQLLLCVATKAESPWAYIPKGGFFYEPRMYAAEENSTIEIDITYVGDANTVFNFNFTCGNLTNPSWTRNMKPPTLLQLDELDKKLKEMKKTMPHDINIITTALKFTSNRNMKEIVYKLNQDKYFDLNAKELRKIRILRLAVQFIDGPKISLVGENVEEADDNGNYVFMEKEQFALQCYAGGLANNTIEWLDSAGNKVIPSRETELGPKTKMDDEGMETFRSSQILKVSAQREISFGCRMNAPSYHSSPYEDTKWFNFRVLSDDTLKSTCNPTNPDCLNETDEPVVVRNSLKLVEFLVEYQS